MSKKRKILLIDTSVLLYDMTAIHSFPGNDIVIPLTVLDELDRFKEKQGLLGENARYVNRYLDNLRATGRLDKSVHIEEIDQSIRVEINLSNETEIPEALDNRADNKIIATALYLVNKHKSKTVTVITKDINLRVKCDALGIRAEDYYKDHIKLDHEKTYTGVAALKFDDDKINQFFTEKKIEISDPDILEKLHPNQFIVGTSNVTKKSFLGVYQSDNIKKLRTCSTNNTVGFETRNKEQAFAVSLLTDQKIQLVTVTGIAGSGKTFLTLMCGMSSLFDQIHERIIVTRSIQPVGRDLGYLPGDINEKMAPWMAPLVDNFRHAFKDMSYFETMRQKGDIEIAPLSYIRGRTFNNAYVIVDEAQNATIHELKTIITRIGKGSKIILLGDTDQIDTPYIDSRSNGLSIIVEKFKASEYTGHIHLPVSQRSDIASLASIAL